MPEQKICPFHLFCDSKDDTLCKKSECELWAKEMGMCSITMVMDAILSVSDAVRSLSKNIKSLDSFHT